MKIDLSKTGTIILTILILLTGVAGGLACLSTPQVYDGPDAMRFSADKAAAWIREIAREPHSVFDTEAHERVRSYLMEELRKLGTEPYLTEHTLKNTDNEKQELKIYNIHAKLEGESDNALLLVSHYDSAFRWDGKRGVPLPGESYGAADAGYGIATILETIRAIKAQNKPLKNDLQILITDAEELGMLGAEKEMQKNLAAYKDVKLVINLEARGIKGPAVMFETGAGNSDVVEFYVKNARMPFTYSFATDIYRLMPNGTDFTRFLEKGYTGYNFAVLDSLDYYHTKKDHVDNINLPSLQHYGEQVLPLVQEFVFVPAERLPTPRSESNEIFFNLLPGVVLHYPQSTGTALLVLLVIVTAAMLAMAGTKSQVSLKRVGAAAGIFFLYLLATALFGTLVAYIAAIICRKDYMIVYLPRVPYAGLIQAGVVTVATVLLLLVLKKFAAKKPEELESVMGAILLNVVLAAVSQVYLPGAAFLFTLPALFAATCCIYETFFKNRVLRTVLYALSVIPILILYIPLVYLFFLALTLGAAGIVAFFALIGLSLLLPLTRYYILSSSTYDHASIPEALPVTDKA